LIQIYWPVDKTFKSICHPGVTAWSLNYDGKTKKYSFAWTGSTIGPENPMGYEYSYVLIDGCLCQTRSYGDVIAFLTKDGLVQLRFL
jgi:hypothetical protein